MSSISRVVPGRPFLASLNNDSNIWAATEVLESPTRVPDPSYLALVFKTFESDLTKNSFCPSIELAWTHFDGEAFLHVKAACCGKHC